MSYEFEGKTIEATPTGYLVNQDDWSKGLAEHIAGLEQIALTERHWDLIGYLRDEYFNNNQNTPNTRTILKAMTEKWHEKIDQKTLYDLFPLDPSKQGGRIAAFLKAAARAVTRLSGGHPGMAPMPYRGRSAVGANACLQGFPRPGAR